MIFDKLKLIKTGLFCYKQADVFPVDENIDVLFICSEAHYSVDFNGRWYSPIVGSWKSFYEGNGLKCQVLFMGFMSGNRGDFCDEVVSLNRFYFHNLLLRVIAKFIPKSKIIIKNREYRFIENFLRRYGVKKIMGVMPNEDWCLIARKVGIPIIDIQHGVINSQHPWYGRDFKANIEACKIPTHFYVWNELSAAVINAWAKDKEATVEVHGDLWLKRFLQPQKDDVIVNESIERLPKFNNKLPCILFTSQWSRRHNLEDAIPNWIVDLILKTPSKYNYIIKLHPVLLHDEQFKIVNQFLFKNFGNNHNVEWVNASGAMLPALLRVVTAHLTYNSSVVIEAASFGIKSAIMDVEIKPGGIRSEYFINEINLGIADQISPSVEVIEAWLSNNVGSIKRLLP